MTNLSGNLQFCGGVGVYMLNQTTLADSVLADKVKIIKHTNAKLLATFNVVCPLHIAAGLKAQNIPINVSPVNIIAKQMGFNGSLD